MFPRDLLQPCYANAGLDRAGHLRRCPETLDRLTRDPGSRIMTTRDGDPCLAPDQSLLWRRMGPKDVEAAAAVFLGLASDGRALFAREHGEAPPPPGCGFAGLRTAAAMLSAGDAHAAATARSLLHWHRQNPYCARCGARSNPTDGGWRRVCGECSTEFFPRTDPVAIMLAVHDGECLLARRPIWPPGRYSCLAGFIEPGESFEDGAAREMAEESGLIWSGEFRYLFSQPWPYPACLMLAAEMGVTGTHITLDAEELSDARWFGRSEIEAMLECRHPEFSLPEEQAVAHGMVKQWAARRRGGETVQ